MLKYDDNGAGKPVVLIHGFPLNRQMWQPQVSALADAGLRVICPDLPGFGESSPVAGSVTIATYADAVIALLDELQVDQAVIGGMSMGGYVVFNLLERYPERFTGAMFLVTRAAADDAAGRQKRSELAEAVLKGDGQVIPDTFAKILFTAQTVADRPELVAEVRQWMETVPAEGVAGGLLAMRDRTDYVDRLDGFTLPALVVGAEQDLAVPLEHAQILANGLHDAILKVIPAAGHMANLEQPELFNRALLDFLLK